MKPQAAIDDKTVPTDGVAERGYEAWRRTKVETALEQAKDRDSMIPAAQVLRDFGLER